MMKYSRSVGRIGAMALVAFFLAVCVPPGMAGAQSLAREIVLNKVAAAGGILYGDPAQWRVVFDDFQYLNTALWDTTSFFGGSVTTPDSTATTGTFYLGRPVQISTLAATNNIVRLRLKGQGFYLLAGKQLEFEARFALKDTANCAWEFGLIAAQDSVTGRGQDTTVGFGMRKRLGNSITWWHKQTAALPADSTATTVRLKPMTWYTLKIIYNGTSVRYWIDNLLVKTDTGALPASSLLPVFEVRTGTTSSRKIYVDYVVIRQQR